MRQLFKTHKETLAREFFLNYAKSDDAYALAQLYAQKVLPSFSSLERLRNKSFDKRDIHKLTSIYLLYSGVFETLARILVVLNRTRKSETVDYDKVWKRSLADVESELLREKRLSVLPVGFNRHIRNSIAHSTYTLRISSERIIFR